MSSPDPAIHDLDCHRGVDFEFSFTMTKDDINVDFTGASLWLTVYEDQLKSNPPVLQMATGNGQITISANGQEVTAAYPAASSAVLAVDEQVYDLDVEFPGGERWRLFTGIFTVQGGQLA